MMHNVLYTYNEMLFKLKNGCNSEMNMINFENNIQGKINHS